MNDEEIRAIQLADQLQAREQQEKDQQYTNRIYVNFSVGMAIKGIDNLFKKRELAHLENIRDLARVRIHELELERQKDATANNERNTR